MEDSVAHLSKAHSLLTGRAFPFFDSVLRHLPDNLLHICLTETHIRKKLKANPNPSLFLLRRSFIYPFNFLLDFTKHFVVDKNNAGLHISC